MLRYEGVDGAAGAEDAGFVGVLVDVGEGGLGGVLVRERVVGGEAWGKDEGGGGGFVERRWSRTE